VLSTICCEKWVSGVCRFELRDEFLDQCERNRVTISKAITGISLKLVAQALSNWRHEFVSELPPDKLIRQYKMSFEFPRHSNRHHKKIDCTIEAHPSWHHSIRLFHTETDLSRHRPVQGVIAIGLTFLMYHSGLTYTFLSGKCTNWSGAMNQTETLFIRHSPVITSTSCYNHCHFD
jgi:hypothetical protein